MDYFRYTVFKRESVVWLTLVLFRQNHRLNFELNGLTIQTKFTDHYSGSDFLGYLILLKLIEPVHAITLKI